MNENSNVELDEDIENTELLLEESDDYDQSPPEDIVAYNELRSCADLFRMYESGQINIQPEFQREVVWRKMMQTEFIDSLAKQLPIPSMCISLDYKTNERMVIDGLQRIATIIKFLDPKNEWRLSKLDSVDKKISGKTNREIREKQEMIYGKIQNTSIPVTILRCDYSKQTHKDYLFTIFHRLNTGGSKLSNQEIRNCIYSGSFNTWLNNTIKNEKFIILFKLDPKKADRFRHQEMVLRFIALYKKREKYNGKLAKFLNDYMDSVRNSTPTDIEAFEKTYTRTINILSDKIMEGQPLPNLSKATMEAVLIGIASNLDSLESKTAIELKQLFNDLRRDPLFSLEALKEGLAQTEKVTNRIKRAIEIFSNS